MAERLFFSHIFEVWDAILDWLAEGERIETRKPEQLCYHPEFYIYPKRPPAIMVGRCKHNMSCRVCGWGWGCAPDPCDNAQAF